ncbi:F-box/kelch-repeat protein At3g23880-like [Chenopodium quinoa]|uniref:F-box/kelch-repeat protein At3g23880-like n=1 Tax=Chenopodium quinoa TaxID=63459 RepID=UPI000B782652|nr:F-box/kelch-repeat protein At3g23880-like [Chenopodium quinoa]
MEKRKNISNPTSIISQLPLDLGSNILLRLPIKDIIRCRCVCKHWIDDIIHHPNFTSLHTRHLLESNRTNPSGSIILFCPRSSRLYSLDYHSPVNQVTRLSNFPMVNQRLIGSCHGLLCFQKINNVDSSLQHYKCRQFSLYNPLTGAVNMLPPLFPKNEGTHIMAGFGYDSVVNHDYKILCFVYSYPFPKQAEYYIYSLKNNSWKFITNKPDFVSKIPCSSCMVYSNNSLYWIARTNTYDILPSITSFDLGREECCDVPYPDRVGYNIWVLADIRGRLHFVNCLNDDMMHVWIMTEYGVNQTWESLIGIRLRQGVVENQTYREWGLPFNKPLPNEVPSYFPPLPLAYSQDGQQALVSVGRNVVAFLECDVRSGKFKELNICGLPDDWKDGYVAMPWFGSLVAPSSELM